MVKESPCGVADYHFMVASAEIGLKPFCNKITGCSNFTIEAADFHSSKYASYRYFPVTQSNSQTYP